MFCDDWPVVPFESVFLVPLRNGLNRPKRVRGQGIPMVNMGELFAYRRIGDIPMELVPVSETEEGKCLLRFGDLLFARQSLVLEGAGKCSIFRGDETKRTFEGHLIRCRLAPERVVSDFYFYFFESPQGKAQIRSIVEQVAAAGIRGSDLRRLNVPLPPLPEQRRIAAVLGALDDKIDLNRKMNKTLEEMAQAIFKSWFIDFDGHTDLVDSELGPIPRGWGIGQLADLSTVQKGLSYRSKYFDPAGLPMANLKCIAPGGGFQKSGLKFYSGDFKDKHVVASGDVVVAMTDLTQKRVVIASPAFIPPLPGQDKIIMSLDLTCVRPTSASGLSRTWLFHRLKTHNFKSFARGFANGTTVLHLKLDGIVKYPFPVPPLKQVEKFTSIAGGLRNKIELNELQSETLAELRDTLLPKLISGGLRVSEVEQQVEDAL